MKAIFKKIKTRKYQRNKIYSINKIKFEKIIDALGIQINGA